MKNNPVKFLKSLLAILMVVLFVLSSCEKSEEEPEDQPALPALSTFKMDFEAWPEAEDSIPEQNSVMKSSSTLQCYTYQHWATAALEVAFWNTAVVLTMALPVASFVEAFNHEPIYHTEGKYWTWSYNFNLGGVHDAELKGYYETDSVVWEMRIDSKLYYIGKVNLEVTEGYWLLKKNPDHTDYWLQIDWARENDSIGEIKYTDILPTSDSKGGYIHYGATYDNLNRYYNINKPVAGNLVQIEWNAEAHNGRLINEAVFGTTDWNCWDELLRDVDCE